MFEMQFVFHQNSSKHGQSGVVRAWRPILIYPVEVDTTRTAPPLSPSPLANAATHGAAAPHHLGLCRPPHAPALPRAPPARGVAPPLVRHPPPRGLRRLRGVLLRRLGVRDRRRRGRGGRRRGGLRLGVRLRAGARRRRARDVGRGGGAGARGAGDAAMPARPAPVRDHGRAPARYVRGGAPRAHPALRGTAGHRRRHVRGGVQPGRHPAGIQHQEEEQPDRAAVHLLRRHIPPRHLLHQARLPLHPAAEAQRGRRCHPVHQLQGPPAEGLLVLHHLNSWGAQDLVCLQVLNVHIIQEFCSIASRDVCFLCHG